MGVVRCALLCEALGSFASSLSGKSTFGDGQIDDDSEPERNSVSSSPDTFLDRYSSSDWVMSTVVGQCSVSVRAANFPVGRYALRSDVSLDDSTPRSCMVFYALIHFF